MRVAYISTFDSFIRANHILAGALGGMNIHGDHFLMMVRSNQITTGQVIDILGARPKAILSLEDTMLEVLKGDYDWIVLSAENTSCRRFFSAFSKMAPTRRPLIATLYPGIIFRHHIDGFSARMPADLVLLNSQKDRRLYCELSETLGMPSDNSFNLGPVTAIGKSCDGALDSRRKVVFFDQPSVPRSHEERAYLFRELLKLADRHPDLEFCVKLRVGPKQETLHKGGQNTLRVFEECNSKAPGRRLSLIEGSSRDVIAQARLCLSVSSTALIEALACGCPAVAITDFGIDDEYGGSFFIGSGIARSLANVDPHCPPSASSAWIGENIGDPARRMALLAEEMAALSSRHRENDFGGLSVFPAYGSRQFFDFATAAFGERRAIERHYRKPPVLMIGKITSFIRRWIDKRRSNLKCFPSNCQQP